jgi:hypothetical protein
MYGIKTKQFSICRVINQTGAVSKDRTCNVNSVSPKKTKSNVIRTKGKVIQKVMKTKSKALFVFKNVSPKTKSKVLN